VLNYPSKGRLRDHIAVARHVLRIPSDVVQDGEARAPSPAASEVPFEDHAATYSGVSEHSPAPSEVSLAPSPVAAATT
jgi:hypothetical protein